METKTIWIFAIVTIVVIGLTFLLIGVLGKHYTYNKDKSECEYQFFTLDGQSKAECGKTTVKKIKEEEQAQDLQDMADRREQRLQGKKRKHAYIQNTLIKYLRCQI